MRRMLVSIVVLFCLTSAAFAASKSKKKSATVEDKSKVTFDVDSCVDKAIDYRTLMVTNPYDNVGKCYWLGFPMVKQQLLSRSVALIGFAGGQQNIFALMDFGKESVPMGVPITGLVMGLGAYEYETVSRSVNTVHHLRKLDGYLKRTKSQQREKDALARSKAEEQAKEQAEELKKAEREQKEAEQAAQVAKVLEIKAVNDRIKAEQEQRKADDLQAAILKKAENERSVYVDSNNGLMWVRNGNIAKKRLNWLDAIAWVKQLDYGGYNDWRMPTIDELKTFSKNGGRGASKHYNANGFNNLNPTYYWTSDSDTSDTNKAFCVYMDLGAVDPYGKYNKVNVFPVRSIARE